ncbi:MAG: carboxypeptidase regulatory-like domain-containing protein [Archangiaceae bacterium]|nr:carboxypeptidase regulatory-like domain-containing protein [Archangiaceae bacterium]
MNGLLILSLCAAAASGDSFTRFERWAKQYRAAEGEYARSQLVDEGVQLATERRGAMLELMRSEPATALAHRAKRDGMPEAVAQLLELPLSGVGKWEVLGVLRPDHQGGIERWFVLGGKRYAVAPHGDLVALKSRDRLWAEGIALDRRAVLLPRNLHNLPGPQQSAWTVGTKPMRFIRVDFSDLPGDPLTLTAAQNLTAQLGTYLRAASFNKTGLNVTVVPMTLRMPKTRAAYGSADDTDGLLNDARAAATNAGFPPGSNGLDVVAFGGVPQWSWSGLGFIGQSGAWLNGAFNLGTLAHEVGHNYGLYHANFWQSQNESIIGAGSSLEYGNPFEIMGDGDGHYNAWYKYDLDWFNPGEVAVAATSNQYRVYDLEQVIGGGTHALKVPIGSTRDYWVEYRPAGGALLARGASINWGYNNSDSSNLLDMTPWTSTAADSVLVVGRTFSDFTSGIHITPVGVAQTMPASLDVVVNRGLFATNHAPTVMLACAVQGPSLDCGATAMDPDADTLAYYWDFGDSQASTNQPTQSRNVTGARDVLARVTVSDMKGGTATASVATKFGNPGTYRITGTVTENGMGVEGVRVFSGNRTTWTNSDGTYTLVGVTTGTYPVQARKTGYTFTAAFTNPVNVGTANVSNINFTGSRATYSISGRVTSVGAGFAGATVSAGIYSTVTDSAGNYTLTGVPAGAYQLTATGPNAENFVVQGFVNPVQVTNMSLTGRNFVELVFPVSGKVTGTTGPHLVTDGTRNANTALNGGVWTWILPKVPPGTWNLRAEAAGQVLTPAFANPITVSSTGVVKDATGTARASFDFAGAAGTAYFVSGYVDEAGGPSLGSLIDAGVALGSTDTDGRYLIQNLPAGTYTLSPAKPGYVFGPASRDVTLPNPDGGLDEWSADFTVLNANVAPSFAFPPHATPSPVVGTTCDLTSLGHDPVEAESTLKYTWSQVFGVVPSTFSRNGTNPSKSTTVTFTKPGAYAFEVKVEDPGGLSSTASVTVAVLQTTTSVAVTPSASMVDVGASRQLVAAVKDQFGGDIDFGGEATWSVTPASCGTITQTGKLTAAAAGTCTVTAEYDGKMGSATVTVVVGAAPRIVMGPTASPSPVTMGTTTHLSVLAEDDEGEAQLTYAWSMVNGPAGVAFSVNGSNAAKNTVATFSAAGTYDLQVEVKDSRDISTSAFLNLQVMAGGLARVQVSGPSSLAKGETGTFTVAGLDLAGASVAVSGCTWASTAGDIDASGKLTAAMTGAVTATCGAVSGSANVTVTDEPMKKGGCGCGSAEGLLLLGALAVLARRRRTQGT